MVQINNMRVYFYQRTEPKLYKNQGNAKLTFFENIFCNEKPHVARRAEPSPKMSKDISVMLAIATPIMMGTKEAYTCK